MIAWENDLLIIYYVYYTWYTSNQIAYVRTGGRGGQGDCVRVAYTGGGGSKTGKILRTYFMNGP